MKTIFKLILILILLILTTSCSIETPKDSIITYIDSNGNNIALKLNLPETPRYSDGAPVIINTPLFFALEQPTLETKTSKITEFGFVEISFLWPGKKDAFGISSQGTNDYGGEDSIETYSDIIQFASGETKDIYGNYISDYIQIKENNLGLYAFSHTGIAATNVLALYPDLNVQYFVGRENPTLDTFISLEPGYRDSDENNILNPYYNFPADYSSKKIIIDYSTIDWHEILEVPFFDSNSNGIYDNNEFKLSRKGPLIFDKYFFSRDLTHALEINLKSQGEDWPKDIATYEETLKYWPFRTTVNNYEKINPEVKILLLFSKTDHILASPDKPHLHQAYDGFTSNGNWIRLNPDSSYLSAMGYTYSSIDNDANTGPKDWLTIKNWSEPNDAIPFSSYASICEMADRTYYNNWEKNLDSTLIN